MSTIFRGRPAVLAAVGAALMFALTAPASAQHTTYQHAQPQQGSAQDMHQSMSVGMEKMMSMKPSGDTDRDFATMMRMHHQMAIDMSKVEQAKGSSAEMKAMAAKIIRDSQRDMQDIDKWLGQDKR